MTEDEWGTSVALGSIIGVALILFFVVVSTVYCCDGWECFEYDTEWLVHEQPHCEAHTFWEETDREYTLQQLRDYERSQEVEENLREWYREDYKDWLRSQGLEEGMLSGW